MELYRKIGKQIKKARKEQEIGQKVLASMLGYTTSTISQYETGKRCINLTDLEKIASTLNRPLTYFLACQEEKKEKIRRGLYVPPKQYKMINAANKLKRRLKEFAKELKRQKTQNRKLENKIQNLMTRVAEQANITNQTARLYNELKINEKKRRESEKNMIARKTIEDIAYQLNNPLTLLLGFIQILISEIDIEDPKYSDLKRLEAITKRCVKIIAELIYSFNLPELKLKRGSDEKQKDISYRR